VQSFHWPRVLAWYCPSPSDFFACTNTFNSLPAPVYYDHQPQTMSEYQQFRASQLRALDVAARISSCLSVLGASFVIASFVSYRPLRKPVNRLVICISIANALSCLAYSWGRYGIKAGRESTLCQTQAFFITWFVMTDPLLVCHCDAYSTAKCIKADILV
jgi:hypothetical protein